jgi:dipeptidyl aminopeptidase/acylaminoacyl peptidase
VARTARASRTQIVAEAGKDSSAWRKRSPMYEVKHLAATTLVLHGEKDPVAPASQARAYVAMAKAAGHTAEAQLFPTAGNPLPTGATRSAIEFFKRQLKE